MMFLDPASLYFYSEDLGFTHRLLNWFDRTQVLALRQNIFKDIPPHFRVQTGDDVLDHELKWCEDNLQLPGVTIGLFDNDRLIAYASILLSSGKRSTDVSQLLKLRDQDFQRSAELSSCMVDERYRGLQLQATLLRWRMELATKHERSLFVSMTACGNYYSMRNLFNAGMSIRWVGQIAPDKWFHGLMFDTHDNSDLLWVDSVLIDWQDFARQSELLDCGYEGVSIDFSERALNNERYSIQFSKRKVSRT